MICDNLEIKNGILYFGNRNTVEIAEKYKTPLYLMDEPTLRKNCRKYVSAMKKYFGENSFPFFASKSCAFKRMIQIASSEGMGIDVVSAGEIYTAVKAGADPGKICFHSNSKTDDDILFAVENGVGQFVVDNTEELEALDRIAGEKGVCQKILLRITPGIDTHTYEAVNTGKVDSKFGFPIETGAADIVTEFALGLKNVELTGFHCHVGSQLFDSDVFIRSAEIMLDFIAHIKDKYSFEAKELDLGGGYGVKYTENDGTVDIEDNIRQVALYCEKKRTELGLNKLSYRMEPGRSIVSDAGITLYKVGNVKRIDGYKNYTAVDGGMGDNPRYALYQSEYTVIAASKCDEPHTFKCDLVGRFCESGDIIQPGVFLPESIKRNDLVAVMTTGAYNYSMASNYNRVPRLPVIMLDGENDYIAVKRETLDDIIKNDI